MCLRQPLSLWQRLFLGESNILLLFILKNCFRINNDNIIVGIISLSCIYENLQACLDNGGYKMVIEVATLNDLEFLSQNDKHISEKELKTSLGLKRIYVAKLNNDYVGWLRYNLFWDSLPFMNMLYILEDYQKNGFGKEFVEYWEAAMKDLGYKTVMTSTLSNEEAQHFYRKLSYKNSGSLLLKDEPLEIIFTKEL